MLDHDLAQHSQTQRNENKYEQIIQNLPSFHCIVAQKFNFGVLY